MTPNEPIYDVLHSNLHNASKHASKRWWPTIDEDIKYHAEYECEECMLELDGKQEKMNLKDKQMTILKQMSPSDWRKPYLEYLLFEKVMSDDLTKEENE